MNPTFIMMVGLPYSGKSYYAEKLSKEYGAVVYSSDAIRAEILGDVQDQNNNGKVFEVLHRRVYDDLSNGKSVIYDATNINYKRRMDTIQRLKRIPCEKVCYLMATPFSECVERSKYRDRVVPYEVLERMYKSIWIPQYYEAGIALKSCTQMDLSRSIPKSCSGARTAWPGSTRTTRITT